MILFKEFLIVVNEEKFTMLSGKLFQIFTTRSTDSVARSLCAGWASCQLRPNSITLSGRRLVRSWSRPCSGPASSCKFAASKLDDRPNFSSLQVCHQLRTCLRPDSVVEFDFYRKRLLINLSDSRLKLTKKLTSCRTSLNNDKKSPFVCNLHRPDYDAF